MKKRWEYKIHEFNGLFVYKLRKFELDEFGKNGWELVQIVQEEDKTYAYFKRLDLFPYDEDDDESDGRDEDDNSDLEE